jgi:hypothetical protein
VGVLGDITQGSVQLRVLVVDALPRAEEVLQSRRRDTYDPTDKHLRDCSRFDLGSPEGGVTAGTTHASSSIRERSYDVIREVAQTSSGR